MTLAATALLVAGLSTINPRHAYGDASAPPDFPTDCPLGQAPPPGYPNPAPLTPGGPSTPFVYTGANDPNWGLVTGKAYSGVIPYKVPFKGIINGGSIGMAGSGPNAPSLFIPDLYASVCGTVSLPSLVGTIPANAINLATPNIYVGTGTPIPSKFKGLEAIPISVTFGNGLVAAVLQQAAPNHGLDTTLVGDTTAAVTTLGMSCSITLNANFTTQTSGALEGQPITGPTEDGQAEVVSNTFGVPAVVGSDTSRCPVPIAATFNKLLGLPARAGVGTFTAPFCFDFELEGPNNPRNAPVPNPTCKWPAQ